MNRTAVPTPKRGTICSQTSSWIPSQRVRSAYGKQMASAEGVTEELKCRDQMAWVGAMNSIRNRADEIVRTELIEV